MKWITAKLKYVARFRYGDALLPDESDDCQFRVFGSNGPYAWSSTANTKSPAIVVGRKGSYGKINWAAKKCFASDTTFFIDSTTCNHNLRWLYYLLQTLKLDEGTDEAAVPGLNREAAYTKEVVVPPCSWQRIIADWLDRETGRLDALVAAKERMLELLTERRQALIAAAVTGDVDSTGRPEPPLPGAFLEEASRYETGTDGSGDRASVAGDDGMTVQSVSPFPTKRLKHVVSLRKSRVHGNESEILYVGLENIESWTGKFFNGFSLTTMENSSLSNVFNPGDVLFGKLRPYLAKVWVAEFAGRSTTECLVMEPVETESRFLGYACLNRDFIDAVDASTFGSKMPRADWDFIRNMPVPVPERHKQRAIADYLDRETARLDELAAKTRETIALLKERRASLIAAAVTGRIDVESSA